MPGIDRPSPISVAQLVARIKGCVERDVGSVAVAGEISSLSAKGHFYFTLKDAVAQIRCVLWASDAERLKFALQNGQKVVARGGVSVYESRGDVQLYVRSVEPVGIGAAELARRQLIEKLADKGYFDRDRKPLPPYPIRIALVTSPQGAAVRDLLEVLRTRWPLARPVVVGCRVQGDEAPREIAMALAKVARLHASGAYRFDLLILSRGGGAAEDLAAFDAEAVADAIVKSPVPVVTGIGHQTDRSIADMVADRECPTPSAVIENCMPDLRALRQRVAETGLRLNGVIADRLDGERQRIGKYADHVVFRRPQELFRERERRRSELARRFDLRTTAILDRHGQQLAAIAARLDGLSPLAVLTRGYSVTLKNGHVVRRSGDVAPGDSIITKLNEGTITSTVTATEPS
jgi:exodeoxyribonuclease VII large subunit